MGTTAVGIPSAERTGAPRAMARERIAALGGRTVVSPAEPHGVSVSVELPTT